MSDLSRFKHIIASGCSFTANGTGGLPPSALHPEGACSFVNDPDYIAIEPLSWAGMVAKKLNVKSFVNVAAGSHGNFLVANNILTLIKKFNYTNKDTLVLFNLSDPARLDLVCDYNHKFKSTHCYWSDDILPYAYVNRDLKITKEILQLTGIENVEMFTSNAVLGMMNYLAHHKINFCFTMMVDYRNTKYLGPVIEEFSGNLVNLLPGVSMYNHVNTLNLLADDKFHPNVKGHESVAMQVMDKINQLCTIY